MIFRILLGSACFLAAIWFFLAGTWNWRLTPEEVSDGAPMGDFNSYGPWVTISGCYAGGRVDTPNVIYVYMKNTDAVPGAEGGPIVVLVKIDSDRTGTIWNGADQFEVSGRMRIIPDANEGGLAEELRSLRLEMPRPVCIDATAERHTLHDFVPPTLILMAFWNLYGAGVFWRKKPASPVQVQRALGESMHQSQDRSTVLHLNGRRPPAAPAAGQPPAGGKLQTPRFDPPPDKAQPGAAPQAAPPQGGGGTP
jgi:hypothetical protein